MGGIQAAYNKEKLIIYVDFVSGHTRINTQAVHAITNKINGTFSFNS